MSQNPSDINPMDPYGAWRTMRDKSIDNWSKMMIDLVNSEAYAESQARMLDSYLTMSTPFRQAMETAMAQLLAQFNMPTRAEVISLAERLTNIEMRLDDMDAKLDQLVQRAGAGSKKS